MTERRTLFALCSDGIYRYCPPECLREELSLAVRAEELKPVLNRVSQLVCSKGAPDNYSLVMVQIL